MENIVKEDKNLLKIINPVDQSPSTKTKKKRKKTKNKKEKKCTGLKELLEQINQEKLEKIKLQQKSQKKESLEKSKEESKIVNSSISGTTFSTLSPDETNEYQKLNSDLSNKLEDNDLKPNYFIKNLELSEDEKYEEGQAYKKTNISSPICDYFVGLDKILSETHKGSVDMANSKNFIKKEDFICSGSLINNNNYNNVLNDSNYLINPDEINDHDNNINNYNNNIKKDEKNDNKNVIKSIINNKVDNNINNTSNNIDLEKKEYEDNNINISNKNYNYLNIPYSQFVDYYRCIMPENSFNNKFNLLNGNIYNNNYYRTNKIMNSNKNNNINKMKDKNKYKNSKIYKNSIPMKNGDWICKLCFNINFSFRTFCNRCRVLK